MKDTFHFTLGIFTGAIITILIMAPERITVFGYIGISFTVLYWILRAVKIDE